MCGIRLLGLLATCALSLAAHADDRAGDPKILVPGPAPLSVELAPTDQLNLMLPNGQAIVRADDVNHVQAQIEIRCAPDASTCAKRAEDLAWEMRRDDGSLEIGLSRNVGKGSQVKVMISVPRDRPLNVSMDYGELTVTDHEQHLGARLKAGELNISMDHDLVREVTLRARVGEAGLNFPRGSVEGRRPTLVGSKVDWEQGPGDYVIDARVRIGEVQVSLSP